MTTRIDISGKDKAEVLAALFNKAKPLGMGIIHYKDRMMPVEEARSLLEERTYFDYVEGRVMKVDLSEAEFSQELYDRDNGQGAAENALRSAGLL